MLVVIAALLGLILVILVVSEVKKTRSEAGLVKKTVNVNLTDGTAIRGVLIAEHSDRISLDQAFYVTDQGQTAFGTLVHVPRERINFVQELPAKVGE